MDSLDNKQKESQTELIYVVECNSGSWDGQWSWIAGVFNNKPAAEALKKKLLEKCKAINDACPPYPDLDNDSLSSEEYLKMDEEYMKYAYHEDNERYLDGFHVRILDFKLNEELPF
jgi:hypothetical protein